MWEMKLRENTIYTLALLLIFAMSGCSLAAQNKARVLLNSPLGFWKTIDDAKGTASSIVQITKSKGKLQGKVVNILDTEKGPNPKCTECTGENKNKPVLGMQILKGLSQDGKEWSGGKILDPKNGKWYKCYIEVLDKGKKLKVRGYIGLALIGRTQYWHRTARP